MYYRTATSIRQALFLTFTASNRTCQTIQRVKEESSGAAVFSQASALLTRGLKFVFLNSILSKRR